MYEINFCIKKDIKFIFPTNYHYESSDIKKNALTVRIDVCIFSIKIIISKNCADYKNR